MQEEVTACGVGEGTSFSFHQRLREKRENHGSLNVVIRGCWQVQVFVSGGLGFKSCTGHSMASLDKSVNDHK